MSNRFTNPTLSIAQITGVGIPCSFSKWARLTILPVFCLSSSCTILKYQIGDESLGNLTESYDSEIPIDKQLPPNRTAILEQLGPPDKVGQLESGHSVFAYEFRDIVERQVGLSIPHFSLLKLSLGKALADRYALLIELDEHNKLHTAGFSNWVEDVGYGFNVQLFISVAPTTDTKALRELQDTEAWTTRLLSSPVGLVDLTHNPDATASGLSFSGMPDPSAQWPSNKKQR